MGADEAKVPEDFLDAAEMKIDHLSCKQIHKAVNNDLSHCIAMVIVEGHKLSPLLVIPVGVRVFREVLETAATTGYHHARTSATHR